MAGLAVSGVEVQDLAENVLSGGQVFAFLQEHVTEEDSGPFGLRHTRDEGFQNPPRLGELFPFPMGAGAQDGRFHIASGFAFQAPGQTIQIVEAALP
jgi:hypothetical protein